MRSGAINSIVVRTTLFILSLSMMLGLVFAWVVSNGIEHREQVAAEARLNELLSAVESTAQVACYLGDRKLASEIGSGLLRTPFVSGVRIQSGATLLYQGGSNVNSPEDRDSVQTVVHTIHSPFGSMQTVGSIRIVPNRGLITRHARSLSHEWTLALAIQAALVAAAVALAIYFLVTRPIRSISTQLHEAHTQADSLITTPFGNESDEIGTLVKDINALTGNLTHLLVRERELRIERELAERRMRLIFEKAATGIFVLDAHGRLLSWNPAFLHILGIPAGQAPSAGKATLADIVAPAAKRIDELIRTSLASGFPADIDIQLDSGAWIECSVNPVGPATLQGFVNDITDRKRAELSARSQADHDPLTGLLNRRGMERAVTELVTAGGLTAPRSVAWLQIDLDRFKSVNDSFGHEAGDIVLRHVARVLQRGLRGNDLVARVGGDEFQALLTNIRRRGAAMDICNALLREISGPIPIDAERRAHIGASIGVALSTPADRDAVALIRRADAALYAAKQSGRGRACFATQTESTPTKGEAA